MKHLPRFLSFILMGLAAVSLTSCGLLEMLLEDLNDGSVKEATNGIVREDQGDGWYTLSTPLPFSWKQTGASCYTDYLPSSGNVHLLVLPIEFSDAPFLDNAMADLNKALNGNGAEDTGYWESVSSFYKKSSYGKVNLSFEIASVYSVGITQRQAYNLYGASSASKPNNPDNGANLMKSAFDSYKSHKGSTYLRNFDSDSNGWIDGIVAVYSGPDYMTGSLSYDEESYFWAYTYWAVAEDEGGSALTWTNPNPSSPAPNLYFFVSIDFLYEAVNSPKVDAHTFIHETGHMFGLDDYYPNAKEGGFNAAGCWSMMDQNILDVDIFSKMILGWANPVIIEDNATVSINPAPSSGDCILVPTSSWNGTAYDEYMLCEFYTPTNLNYLDSHTRYPTRQLGYTDYGIKIYHVDARLVKSSAYDIRKNWTYVTDPKSENPYLGSDTFYSMAATNCQKNASKANVNFSLLHLMEADGVNTFKNGGVGTNLTLFHKGQSFNFGLFGYGFFPNRTKMNNGVNFSYRISVTDITESSATLSFTKN